MSLGSDDEDIFYGVPESVDDDLFADLEAGRFPRIHAPLNLAAHCWRRRTTWLGFPRWGTALRIVTFTPHADSGQVPHVCHPTSTSLCASAPGVAFVSIVILLLISLVHHSAQMVAIAPAINATTASTPPANESAGSVSPTT
jgi:hypothetical protein